MTPSTVELIGTSLFVVAIAHTLASKFFEQLALQRPTHAGLWHLLSEVEVVFGFWALVLVVSMFAVSGSTPAMAYLESRNFTEPMFVFAIMLVAASRPVLHVAKACLRRFAQCLPLPGDTGYYFTVLMLAPLLGSFITEPAAMTLSALILSEHFFSKQISARLKYATLGVLFVNISIGGVLTPFAAPPVLMVASTWHWELRFMLLAFGWKAVIAVVLNTLCATLIFRQQLSQLPNTQEPADNQMPFSLILLHLMLLAGIVVFAHHPVVFVGLLLCFLGVSQAYQRYQDRLILREGLLVAFFLAGLVVLGGQQRWWLQPLLMHLNSDQVFFGAIALTAFTDNAALTYLGSLVDGFADSFKYALVAGAVTGGGLTIIANAPNPAGISILRSHFAGGAVHPLGLLLAALPPTVIAALAFRFL